jgi:hypothetical protein
MTKVMMMMMLMMMMMTVVVVVCVTHMMKFVIQYHVFGSAGDTGVTSKPAKYPASPLPDDKYVHF